MRRVLALGLALVLVGASAAAAADVAPADGPSAVDASSAATSVVASGGTTGAVPTHEDVTFAAFEKKVARGVSEGKLVSFTAGLGDAAFQFLLKQAPREQYDAVQLLRPGEAKPTRNFLFGYLLRGTEAHKHWKKLAATADKLNATGGVRVRGRAHFLGTETYPFPVGVIIDAVEKSE